MPEIKYLVAWEPQSLSSDSAVFTLPYIEVSGREQDALLAVLRPLAGNNDFVVVCESAPDGYVRILLDLTYAVRSREMIAKYSSDASDVILSALGQSPEHTKERLMDVCRELRELREKFLAIEYKITKMAQGEIKLKRKDAYLAYVDKRLAELDDIDKRLRQIGDITHPDTLESFTEGKQHLEMLAGFIRRNKSGAERVSDLQSMLGTVLPAGKQDILPTLRHYPFVIRKKDVRAQDLFYGGRHVARLDLYTAKIPVGQRVKAEGAVQKHFLRVTADAGEKSVVEIPPGKGLEELLWREFGAGPASILTSKAMARRQIAAGNFRRVYEDDNDVGSDYKNIHEQIRSQLLNSLPEDKQPINLLFLGFGDGLEVKAISESLAELGQPFTAYGIEYNPDSVKVARGNVSGPSIHLYQGDATRLDEADRLNQLRAAPEKCYVIASGFLTAIVNKSHLEALQILQQTIALGASNVIISGRTSPAVTHTLAHMAGMNTVQKNYLSDGDSRALFYLQLRPVPDVLPKIKVENRNNLYVVDMRGMTRVNEVIEAMASNWEARPPANKPAQIDLSLAYLRDVDVQSLKLQLDKLDNPYIILSGRELGFREFMKNAAHAGLRVLQKPLSEEDANNVLRVPRHMAAPEGGRSRFFAADVPASTPTPKPPILKH